MLKINLDNLDIRDIIILIDNNPNDIFLFYNDISGTNLNGKKILEIIFYLNKYKSFLDYYFYNIPFCFFSKFGRNFIDKHCIRNRLCNYYDGYITYNKCNICRYGLFCNNFNSKISKDQVLSLERFKEDIINKEYLLEIINEYKLFCLSLGYDEDEISFYTTQKYIVEFLDGEIEFISKNFLSYLTIYLLLDNKKLSTKLFESLDSFTLVLKDKNINNNLNNLVNKYGVNVNFTLEKAENVKLYNYKGQILKLEYYFSRLKYNGKRDFFDFTTGFLINKSIEIFKGIVYNKKKIEVEVDVFLVKRAGDSINNPSSIYMGRDILSGSNLNNFKGIIISSDGLGKKGRLIQSLNSIKIPIIYNIEPDFNLYLKNGDKILINFYTGELKKI